jgi:ABC-2 type transport system permease protein
MIAFAAAVRAEWTKAHSVRSTWWSLFVATVLCVGLGVLIGRQTNANFERWSAGLRVNWDPTQLGFYSLMIGQVALVVFGVLLVSTEYTTGMIRTSLAAVPRRGSFLAAKAAVATAIAGTVSVVIGFGTFFAAQWGLGEHGTTISQPGVLRAVLGACAFLTLMCLFSMAVAMMLRNTALCLGIMIPLLFLNSQGLANLPAIRPVTQYLPDQAGAGMMQVVTGESIIGHRDFGPSTAFLIMLTWVVAALTGAYVTLRRRDA